MIEIVNYHPDFLKELKPKAIHAGELSPEIKTQAVCLIRKPEHAILAIFGGAWLCPGVMHIWAFISDEVHKGPRAFHEKTLELLGNVQKIEGLRRLQIDVREDYPEGIKWAESLGFKREGLMHGYAPDGSPSWLFGKVVTHVG